MSTFGERVKEARLASGLTQAQLAKRAGFKKDENEAFYFWNIARNGIGNGGVGLCCVPDRSLIRMPNRLLH